MKRAAMVVSRDYQNNRLFDLSNPILNRDNCLYPYALLKNELVKKGYELVTSDLCAPETADLVIYNEMPKPFTHGFDKEKSYLLLFESELVRPDNWIKANHLLFNKVFTWNDDYVDGKNYIKFNFPNSLKITEPDFSKRTTLATLISGNKTSTHPNELYSERVKTISWFEKNHPEEFHYYGVGWDYKLDLRWQKVFKKLKIKSLLPKNKSVCFKGKVKEKHEALKQYKFAICYENARDINGYITEKIFDCLFAGCVPVYWGPANIEKFIPANCFIDRRKFQSHEALYSHLKSLSNDSILDYQNNINNFLSSKKFVPFSDKFFAANIIGNIFEE